MFLQELFVMIGHRLETQVGQVSTINRTLIIVIRLTLIEVEVLITLEMLCHLLHLDRLLLQLATLFEIELRGRELIAV